MFLMYQKLKKTQGYFFDFNFFFEHLPCQVLYLANQESCQL